MNCQEVREGAAVALLRRTPLDPVVADHLAGCAQCRTEVDQLVPVVALLELGPPLAAAEAPSDLLLRRLLTTAAHERRRRRVAVALAAVAALVIVIPGIAYLVSNHGSSPSSSHAAIQASASDPASGVSGTVELRPSSTGSELAMTVAGVSPGTRCSLVVVDRAGTRHIVDTWTATYRGDAEVTTQTPVPVSQVSRVELVDTNADSVLLHLTFT